MKLSRNEDGLRRCAGTHPQRITLINKNAKQPQLDGTFNDDGDGEAVGGLASVLSADPCRCPEVWVPALWPVCHLSPKTAESLCLRSLVLVPASRVL